MSNRYETRFKGVRFGSYDLRADAALAYDYAIRAIGMDSKEMHNKINFNAKKDHLDARNSEMKERCLTIDLLETLKFIETKVVEGMTKLLEKEKGTASTIHKLQSMKQNYAAGSMLKRSRTTLGKKDEPSTKKKKVDPIQKEEENLYKKVYPTKPRSRAEATKQSPRSTITSPSAKQDNLAKVSSTISPSAALNTNAKRVQKVVTVTPSQNLSPTTKSDKQPPRSLAGYHGVSRTKSSKYEARFKAVRVGTYILKSDAALAHDGMLRKSGVKKDLYKINFVKRQDYMTARKFELKSRSLAEDGLLDLVTTLNFIETKVDEAIAKYRRKSM